MTWLTFFRPYSVESQGVVAACVYLVIQFLYIPIQFKQTNTDSTSSNLELQLVGVFDFQFSNLVLKYWFV